MNYFISILTLGGIFLGILGFEYIPERKVFLEENMETCACENLECDSLTLIAFYEAIDSMEYIWDINQPITDWPGVVMENNRVTGLDFININISGLSGNSFTGVVPEELGQLQNLIQLNLSGNEFSGQIPASLGTLNNLAYLYLNNNQLEGCFSEGLRPICERLQQAPNHYTEGYDFKNNPQLPWQGDFERFCNDEEQIGAPCDDGNPNTFDDKIRDNCECKGIEINSCRYQDSLALVALYNATNGDGWTFSWPLEEPMTNWNATNNSGNSVFTSVILNEGSGCVEELIINGNNLNGYLPDSLGLLSGIVRLQITGNENLTGAIPPSIGDLSSLTQLSLSNRLSGTIPSSLCSLEHLTVLYLASNVYLNGAIPPCLGELDQLETLVLQTNQLQDTIPFELGRLSKLKTLLLNSNNLTGTIPDSLGRLGNLEHLYLSFNNLSGIIPPSLGSLTNLRELLLESNSLEDNIPMELGQLENLELLFLQNNQFIGVIPLSLGNLSQLEALMLFNNQLEGTLPDTLASLPLLTKIYLQDNQLEACFPPSYQQFCSLGFSASPLNIGYNFLNNSQLPWQGDFERYCNGEEQPNGFCNNCNQTDYQALIAFYNAANGQNWTIQWDLNAPMEEWYGIELTENGCVQSIFLDNNNLSGFISPEIGNLSYLRKLHLVDDPIEGVIPPEIGNLDSLRTLVIGLTEIAGPIPTTIGNLTALTSLTLRENNLEGNIPTEIGQLQQLTYFQVDDNNLSGSIPPQIENLSQLAFFDVSNNSLSGEIPPEFNALTKLEVLDFSVNELTGTIPPLPNLFDLDLAGFAVNQFTGTVPDFRNSPLIRLWLTNNKLDSLPPFLWEINTFGNQPDEGLQADRNNFTFDDILPNLPILGFANFSYVPQNKFFQDTTFIAYIGENLTIDVGIDAGIDADSVNCRNEYIWSHNGSKIYTTDRNELHLSNLTAENAGEYRVKVYNPCAPSLILESEVFHVEIENCPLEFSNISVENCMMTNSWEGYADFTGIDTEAANVNMSTPIHWGTLAQPIVNYEWEGNVPRRIQAITHSNTNLTNCYSGLGYDNSTSLSLLSLAAGEDGPTTFEIIFPTPVNHFDIIVMELDGSETLKIDGIDEQGNLLNDYSSWIVRGGGDLNTQEGEAATAPSWNATSNTLYADTIDTDASFISISPKQALTGLRFTFTSNPSVENSTAFYLGLYKKAEQIEGSQISGQISWGQNTSETELLLSIEGQQQFLDIENQTSPLPFSFVIPVTENTQPSLEASFLDGSCSIDASIDVTPTPFDGLDISVTNTTISCQNGNGTASVQLNGNPNDYSFNWNTGATTSSINNLAAGTYTVTVSNGNCSKTLSAIVGVDGTPELDWQQIYTENGAARANSLIQRPSGNILVAGTGISEEETDMLVIETNQAGDNIGTTSFDNNGAEGAEHIILTSDGGYLLVGYTTNTQGCSGNNRGAWVIKTNANLQQQWNNIYARNFFTEVRVVKEREEGGYIIAGSTVIDTINETNFWIGKISTDGRLENEVYFVKDKCDYSHDIIQTRDGGFLVTGTTVSSGSCVGGNYDVWISKLDNNLCQEWEYAEGTENYEVARTAVELSNGNFLIAGVNSPKVCLLVLTSNGSLSNTYTYSGNNSDGGDKPISIIATDDGGFVIAANTLSTDLAEPNNGGIDVWVFKIDSSFQMLWSKVIGTEFDESPSQIIQADDGSFYIAGTLAIGSDESVIHDFWVAHLHYMQDVIEMGIETTPTSCSQSDGSATILFSDNADDYNIQWSNGSTQSTIENLERGTYTVTVSDDNCSIEKSVTIDFKEKPIIEWDKNFGGLDSDYPFSITEDSQGNFLIAGTSKSIAGREGSHTKWLISVDSEGNLNWTEDFLQQNILGNDDFLFQIIPSRLGGYFLVGYEGIEGTEFHNGWIAKMNENRTLEWEQEYETEGDARLTNGLELKNGNIVVSGDIGSDIWWIMLINPHNGEIIWEYQNGILSRSKALGIAETPDGGFVVCGYETVEENDLTYEKTEGRVTRFSANGDSLWTKIYGTDRADLIYDIVANPSGGFYTIGLYNRDDVNINTSCQNGQIWLMNLDEEGNMEDQAFFGNQTSHLESEIQLLPNGDIMVLASICGTGNGISNHYGDSDLWLARLSPNLELLWEKNFGGNQRERLGAFAITNDGSFIITGESNSEGDDVTSPNLGNQDFWVAKLQAPLLPKVTLEDSLHFCEGEIQLLEPLIEDCEDCQYLWNQGSVTNTLEAMETGQYEITITDENGCTASATIELIEQTLSAQIEPASTLDCNNPTITLTATTSNSGNNIVYQWQNENGDVLGGDLDLVVEEAGLYFLTITENQNNCQAIDSIQIEIENLPPAAISFPFNDTTLCDTQLAISANLPLDAQGMWEIEPAVIIEDILNPQTQLNDLETGTYELQWILSTDDCPDYSTDTLTVTVAADTLILNNDVFQVENGSSFIGNVLTNDVVSPEVQVTYLNYPTSFPPPGNNTPFFSFTPNENCSQVYEFQYEVLSTICGILRDTADVRIEVQVEGCEIPTHFSPNGDGFNDWFIIPQIDLNLVDEAVLVITNRWGDVVFEMEYMNGGNHQWWDGDGLPEATYFYVLNLGIDSGSLTGSITLMR